MKIFVQATFLLFLSLQLSFAQQAKHGVGVHFAGLDFYGPQAGKYFSSDRLNRVTLKTESKFKWDPSIRFTYWYMLAEKFDFNAAINVSNLQHPNSNADSVYIKMKDGINSFKTEFLFASLDARLNYNILPRKTYIVSPYVSAGTSLSMQEQKRGFSIPLGLGANIHVGRDIYINLSSDYRFALGNWAQNNFMHSVGLVYWFGGNKMPKAIPPPPTPAIVKEKDSDNDGLLDKDDECPNEAGKKELRGCPDRDSDGIVDKSDRCPDIKGIAKYQGCPVPDKDKDGFADEDDRCPDVFSLTNRGCPEIKKEVIEKAKKAAAGVNFASGSAKLLPASFVNLDNLVDILNEDSNLQAEIEGHTDNKGAADKNLTLSQARADACKAYLVSKGINAARLISTGYGDSKPIADNATDEGRAKNRRTEFVLKN